MGNETHRPVGECSDGGVEDVSAVGNEWRVVVVKELCDRDPSRVVNAVGARVVGVPVV